MISCASENVVALEEDDAEDDASLVSVELTVSSNYIGSGSSSTSITEFSLFK